MDEDNAAEQELHATWDELSEAPNAVIVQYLSLTLGLEASTFVDLMKQGWVCTMIINKPTVWTQGENFVV